MSFLELCEDEPLIKTLREVFRANIVRVPEERIKPLSVLANKKDRLSFLGNLNSIIKKGPALELEKNIIFTSQMADISGRRTRKVNLSLGMKVLEGFLNGFNLPSISIVSKFEHASEVSFSFKNVRNVYIDIGLLGSQLSRYPIDKTNPATGIFFDDDRSDFLIINSVIQSSDFSVNVDKSSDQNFNLDIPAIQEMVAQANVGINVATTTGYDLIFKGDKFLSFAFSCIKLLFDDDGKIFSMPAFQKPVAFGMKNLDKPSLEPLLLNEKSGLVSWD